MNSPEDERSHKQNLHRKLIAAFSIYLVENNGSLKLVSIPELEALFVLLIDDLIISEDGWARYFLLTLRQDVSALLHTANQEAQTIHCQMKARKAENLPFLVAQFLDAPQARTRQFLLVYLDKIVQYAVRDYYRQVIEGTPREQQYPEDILRYQVLDKASDPQIFLKNFDHIQTTKIKTYANQKVRGMIDDRLKKGSFAETIRRMTDEGLLKGLTQRQFGTALQAVEPLNFPGTGSNLATNQSRSQQKQAVIDCYLSLIYLYNQVHQPKGTGRDRLPPATDEQLQIIADCYNQAPEGVTGNDVKTILETSVRAARAYYGVKPTFHSLDKSFSSGDLENDHRTLEVPSPSEPFLQQLIDREGQKMIATSVTQAFSELSHPEPITLYLEYGLKLKQAAILHLLGTELGVKQQYGVSRRVKAFRRKLFKILTQSWQILWQTNYGDKPDPERLAQRIDSLEVNVDEYLTVHCQRVFYSPLNAVLQQLYLNKASLNLGFNPEWMSFYQVCKTNLQKWLILEVFSTLFDAIKFALFRTALKAWIQKEFNVDLETAILVDPKIDEKLDRLIETWFHEGDE
jgi:hypothetical protein